MRRLAHRLFGSVVAVATVGLVSAPSFAQTAADQGISFLIGSQDPAGSWGNSRPGTTVRDTATVVDALQSLDRTQTAEFGAATFWLSVEPMQNADDLSRTVLALSNTSLSFSADDARARLLLARAPRSGWGLSLTDTAAASLDTALALRAAGHSLDPLLTIDALSALVGEQNLDGPIRWSSRQSTALETARSRA